MSDAPKCAATTRGGKACGAYARPGHPTCAAHDPEMREQMTAARRLGGQRGRRTPLPVPDEPVKLRTIDDARAYLERAAADALRLDHGVARTRLMKEIALDAARLCEQHDLERDLAAFREYVQRAAGDRRRSGGRRAADAGPVPIPPALLPLQ